MLLSALGSPNTHTHSFSGIAAVKQRQSGKYMYMYECAMCTIRGKIQNYFLFSFGA